MSVCIEVRSISKDVEVKSWKAESRHPYRLAARWHEMKCTSAYIVGLCDPQCGDNGNGNIWRICDSACIHTERGDARKLLDNIGGNVRCG